jgi:hypothetical protein
VTASPAKRTATAATAGYSGRPLAKKLGIKDGHAVALLNAPDGFEATLSRCPTG